MTTTSDLLIDAFERVRGIVHSALRDATQEDLTFRPDDDANTIAWLVWHLSRGQDRQIADAAGSDEVWTSGGWVERFDLPFHPAATGYGQSADEVGAVRSSAELLSSYHDAVCDRTIEYLGGITETELDRIVDPDWNPPVTLAVRLVSILSDDLQHAGQASYVRGLARRAN
jgi:uncharacterized damage-inducible protein DinB